QACAPLHTLSLHDALPILKAHAPRLKIVSIVPEILPGIEGLTPFGCPEDIVPAILGVAGRIVARAAYDALVLRGTIGHGLRLLRSEEHTSELQSPDHLVCR